MNLIQRIVMGSNPEPRVIACETCKHWNAPLTPLQGTCRKLSGAVTGLDVIVHLADGNEDLRPLVTRDHFGCTLHEPKDTP